jgi:hypothetical protein
VLYKYACLNIVNILGELIYCVSLYTGWVNILGVLICVLKYSEYTGCINMCVKI